MLLLQRRKVQSGNQEKVLEISAKIFDLEQQIADLERQFKIYVSSKATYDERQQILDSIENLKRKQNIFKTIPLS